VKNGRAAQYWRNSIFLAGALALAPLAPPAYAADPPPLSAYGDLPGVERMALAPDGKTVAFVAEVEGQRNVLVFDADHKLLASMPLADSKVRDLAWGDTSHLVVTVSRTENLGAWFTKERAELLYAAVLSTNGEKLKWVFQRAGNMLPFVNRFDGFRIVGGRTFGFFEGQATTTSVQTQMDPSAQVGGRVISRPALYSVDLATMQTARVPSSGTADSDYSWKQWWVGADGTVTATLGVDTRNGSWRLLGPKGQQLAKGIEPSGSIEIEGLTQGGAAVVYGIRAADDEWHRYSVPLTGGSSSAFLQDRIVRSTFEDKYTGELIGYEPNDPEGQAVPVMFDPVRQDRVSKIYRAFRGKRVRLQDFTSDLSAGLVRTSGNGDAGSWYTVDVVGKTADIAGEERPAIPAELVGPVSMVTYKAADGLAMYGVLTLPAGRPAKGLPVVLLPHGGPHARDVAMFDWWAQALASRGYAVFQPNFRGSTDQTAAFMHAGDGQWGRKMQTDISDGLAELARRGIVDAKRACIVGASYGGYAALAGVTLQQGIYRCAVAVAPVSDLSQMVATDQSESGYDPTLGRNLREMFGSYSTLGEVSPRKHAANADAPIMLIHGKDDTVVPFSQSSRMADALRSAGKPYEMVVMPNEDHWLSHGATRQAMLEACVRFVLKNNPPG